MAEVQIIKANADGIKGRRRSKTFERIRVAAYCRVSTDSEEQIHSYNSQVSHYKSLVESKPEWSLVDIYADEGITGTQVLKRTDFQRMINDALDDKIDLIITKSISRFARNTLDTLKYVRLLKERNVAILFEKENINTLTMNGEMLLVILSSLAQQEVESTSANVKMGLKMKMKRGELVGFQGCLGYDYDPVTKSISVNEEEAEVVRYIFQRYIDGAGCFVIAKELTKLKYKTKRGNTKWGESTVRGIIKNEKYKGDILLGKTFTLDPISHRRLENMGEEEKYYLKDHHEPIISEEMFEEAQRILNKRSETSTTKGVRQKYSRKYAFSSIIKCAFCGATATRRTWHSGYNHEKYVWQCVVACKHGKKNCPDSKGVSEEIIEQAFVESFNIMCRDNKEVIEEFLQDAEKRINTTNCEKELRSIERKIASNEDKIKKLLDMRMEGEIDKENYTLKYNELRESIEKLKSEKFDMESNFKEENINKKRIDEFRKKFNSNKPIEKFDRATFDSIVEQVVLGGETEDGEKNSYMVTFVFKTGLKASKDCSKFKGDSSSEETYSYTADESEEACSLSTDDTC
ncbi:recombinase family protein [Clostridium tyrobutyricum]|uniref:recombinase family protein n=1 Tax=Clostridium tyrobutyricum TaxID=1519 RepID=UPI001C3861DD|nr:recombinase family protein [Clostridium tyrobutyricum]MBV4420352.1 recombinase family protein [Clostridium tyrobutyricum]